MWDVLLDAFLDSIKIFPFILLIYILMEAIEHAGKKESIERILGGPFAPAVAGVLGAVPECGFAVMCAKLYDKGLIKTGTLIAAFLSISDEGLIILITEGAKATDILLLLGIKIAYAIAVGEILNLLFARKDAAHICPERDDCIECGAHHEKNFDKYFLHPLSHTVKTFLYVLVINFALGTVIYLVTEESITAFMDKSVFLQPLIASLIGLIPNCGSSIILAKAFTGNILNFAGLIAGLSANSGIGILILLKSKTNYRKAFMIIGLQYILAVILGYLITGVISIA